MRIAVIGTGYVGLVSGTCFSEMGTEVICVDKDISKIERLKNGQIPIYEPGLDKMVARNVAAGRLHFTTTLQDALKAAQAVFIAVGTPTRYEDGHADLSYVYAAAREIAENITDYCVIVTKSTVPVGTGREIEKIMRQHCPHQEFDVCSNPEFLREGCAIEDFMKPDRILVGCNSLRAQHVMEALYQPLVSRETPLLFTQRETAEMSKYAANAFLAMKISFMNEIANLCEKVGADVQDIAKAIGHDHRIAMPFLQAGPGYGGSCFPKDTLALVRTAQYYDAPIRLIETTIAVNDARKKQMAQRVIDAVQGDVKNKKIAVLGVAFKPNTDDMRDSPAIDIIHALQLSGVSVHAHDPVAMHEAQKVIHNVTWANDAYECIKGAEAVVLITEWNEYKTLDLVRVKELLNQPVFVDLRNVYRPQDMARIGLHYSSIGRPATNADCKIFASFDQDCMEVC